MIKAIFTNIKDEHRYLEEWFEHHIRMGFNKFIIYEDYGSMSHESIIEKYSKVTNIDYYDYVLEKDSLEFKDITCMHHIQDNYNDLDWLIKLDPDEYIMMPEGKTIDDILYNIDDKYDQIVIKWKLYNANGFINQPYSGKYSLVDTYIDYVDKSNIATYFGNNISENTYDIGKSIIRYKKICGGRFPISDSFPHLILEGDENTVSGEKYWIYINHYITKSFEEFYNRLKSKGEYNKKYYRKLGDFFVLNPDMISKIPEIESKFNIDIFSFETKVV